MLINIQAILSEKIQLTADIVLFRFNLSQSEELIFNPGQYLVLSVSQPDGQVAKRLYSIASSNEDKNNFELLIQIVPNGVASTYLENLNIGDKVSFQGPAGVFGIKENNKDKIFLVTGTGIAPVRSILKSKFQNPNVKENLNFKIQIEKIYLFWGLPYFSEVCLLDELKHFSQNPNFKFKICVSRETNLNTIKEEDRIHFTLGRVTKGLAELYEILRTTPSETTFTFNNFDYYLCGGRDVIEGLKTYLYGLGVEKDNVIFEKF